MGFWDILLNENIYISALSSLENLGHYNMKGVNKFLKFSFDHAKVPNYICCPCMNFKFSF